MYILPLSINDSVSMIKKIFEGLSLMDRENIMHRQALRATGALKKLVIGHHAGKVDILKHE